MKKQILIALCLGLMTAPLPFLVSQAMEPPEARQLKSEIDHLSLKVLHDREKLDAARIELKADTDRLKALRQRMKEMHGPASHRGHPRGAEPSPGFDPMQPRM